MIEKNIPDNLPEICPLDAYRRSVHESTNPMPLPSHSKELSAFVFHTALYSIIIFGSYGSFLPPILSHQGYQHHPISTFFPSKANP
jgi:hypothetical protein